MAIPVHVIGGFLGAGKTTALLSLLERSAGEERAAVVINDFGESAIDEGSLQTVGVAISEIRGGCVCCTAPEGFMAAIGQILDEVKPDRIYIEPTGLARPADLIDTLRRAPYADQLDIRPLIILVDPHVLATDPRVADNASVADVLVANRIDLASAAERAAFDSWAGALWPEPLQILRVEHGFLPLEVLDGVARTQAGAGLVHDHGHGHVVRTSRWAAEVVFNRRRLIEVFEGLKSESRVKGVFRTDEGVARFDIAGGVLHEKPSDYRGESRVDVISTDEARLGVADAGFAAAIRTEAERLTAGTSIEIALPDGTVRRFDRASLMALEDAVADVAELIENRSGVAARLSSLFAAIDAPMDAEIVVVAADGYTTPPVAVSAVVTGLLLHSLDGEPLPAAKGGPFRLLIPGDAGPGGPCANVKAVVRIAIRWTSGRRLV